MGVGQDNLEEDMALFEVSGGVRSHGRGNYER